MLFAAIIWIVVVSKLISFIGRETIADFIWKWWILVGAKQDLKSYREAQAMANDVLLERSKVSAKDDFARWAKLDRELTRLKAEVEDKGKVINSQKTTFKRLFSLSLQVLVSGTKLYLRLWYRRAAVMWIPDQLALPYPVLWILSLSSSPIGSLSVSSCMYIIDKSIGSTLDSTVALWRHSKPLSSLRESRMQKPKVGG